MTATHRAGQVLIVVTILLAGLTSLGMAALVVPLASAQRSAVPKSPSGAPTAAPVSQPRLTFEQLRYVGAFRLPAAEVNGDSFSFGGYPVAYNPDNNSLFVGARGGKIAELSIPSPASAPAVEALPFAEFMQTFADPAEGHIKDIDPNGASLSGLLVYDHRLIGTGVIYYDAVNSQALSHFTRPLQLNASSASKMVRVGSSGKTGFVAGYMALVPPEWQTALGAPVVTGQCCLPIISRTSWGPAAFAFDPTAVAAGKNASADALLYYDGDHATLGPWEGSNPTYGGSTEVAGLALIKGTRTALFIGRNGLGTFCYGDGTSDQSRHKTRGPNGEEYCYDPTTSDKGQHAYPYRTQMWAYDLGELAEVRAGHRDPWSVKPYAVWPFDLPFPEQSMHLGGVGYDPARQLIYITQMRSDRDGYAFRPLVHVFHIQ